MKNISLREFGAVGKEVWKRERSNSWLSGCRIRIINSRISDVDT